MITGKGSGAGRGRKPCSSTTRSTALLAGLGAQSGAAALEDRGVLGAQPLDLFAGLAEAAVEAALLVGYHLAHADGSRGLGDLAVQSLLQPQQLVEPGVGEHAAQKDLPVLGADPVDAPVTLNETSVSRARR